MTKGTDTVPLEIAKQLRDLGYPGKTNAFWYESKENEVVEATFGEKKLPFLLETNNGRPNSKNWISYPAPNAISVLEQLPARITFEADECVLVIYKEPDGSWTVAYQADRELSLLGKQINRETLVLAATAMWVWLKHNN